MDRVTRWTALVLAGSRPGPDAFAASMGTDLKALIPVAGEPMVVRPVRALLAAPEIAAVRVLAQQPERIAAVLPADPRLTVAPSRGTIAETVRAICADPATAWPLLITTADHALLSPAMIAEFCAHAGGADVAIGVVERATLQKRLPQSQRTWIKFRGGAYSGANLFILRSPSVAPALEQWRAVEQDRKKALALLWSLGPSLFLGAALRLRTLAETLHRVSLKLHVAIHAVALSDGLAAVDVDKPADHILVEAIIAGRA
ncbi:nucleotidyltransferase family protein [Sphingomonas sp.]|uniref:nucleotidyltransferase family protein n=1 Tax=Sphingomonas sp. TaxID=28214 RepID=UPI00286DAF5C|nr:nucleotidyltransferase family protein [Sphingomonas sp.]